jgi:tellurite resistance protein
MHPAFWYAGDGSVLNKHRVELRVRAARSAFAAGAHVDPAKPPSILSFAAGSYGARPSEDTTIPTGFDPVAVVLFETIVEGAYLVANADGLFDDEERRVFEHIVVEACGGAVASQQITALVASLHGQLRRDGVDRRIENLAKSVSKREHAQEVLRMAALIGQASDGVSAVEHDVLTKIATDCGLEARDVDAALSEVKRALAVAATE